MASTHVRTGVNDDVDFDRIVMGNVRMHINIAEDRMSDLLSDIMECSPEILSIIGKTSWSVVPRYCQS